MESGERHIYFYFWIFGLINNVLYVVILSAAVDIVGPTLPKSLVLLADILPAFIIKLLAPFFIHKIAYKRRVWSLIVFSCLGMLLVSIKRLSFCLTGIVLASLSSGFGEVTFLQLTHIYKQVGLNGWSSGTGGAGLVGSAVYMLLTSMLNIPVKVSLLVFSVLPFGFLLYFRLDGSHHDAGSDNDIQPFLNFEGMDDQTDTPSQGAYSVAKSNTIAKFANHFLKTCSKLKELVIPFMLPLTTVYLFEYLINQAVSPTLLFPLNDKGMPFFFRKYRDIYVTYGTLYQLGVFISRSTASLFRMKRLYFLSALQGVNLIFTILQSWSYILHTPWPIMCLIFYEGLLGGASYVNTFLNILEKLPPEKREFGLGSVSIADSFGVLVAAIIGLVLEPALCSHQVADDRPWCTLE